MNNLQLLLFLSAFLFLFTACDNDDDNSTAEGTLEIFFEPVYGAEGKLIDPITNFTYANGNAIRIVVSDMFLGNISLGAASSTKVLSEVEYINLSEPTKDQSTGLTDKFLVLNKVPAGEYSFFEFGIGVPPELNNKRPTDFPSSHPLSRSSHYWDPWNSYIFAKLEGKLDLQDNGSFNHNFVYHSGKDELYRVLRAEIPISIKEGEVTRIKLVLDHEKLLVNDVGEFVDIENVPIDHSAGELDLMKFIVDNYGRAFTLELLSQ